MNIETRAAAVLAGIRDLLQRSLTPIGARLKALEERQPQKGEDGKSVTVEDVTPLIAEQVAKAMDFIPKPKDGERGEKGEDGKVDPELVKAEVAKAVAEIPKPKDGEKGEPGRDALSIDILPLIDVERCYGRGTFAQWQGGIIKAFRTTEPIVDGDIARAGWETIVRGVASIDIEQTNERKFSIVTRMSDGHALRRDFSVPSLIDRGVYKPDSEYQKGDGVTWGGSWFIAKADNPQGKPGESDDWRLAVKRGRDGKDGGSGGSTPVPTVKLR